MLTYPHCRHCATSHPAHVDVHTTSCGSYNGACEGSQPIPDEALFGLGGAA